MKQRSYYLLAWFLTTLQEAYVAILPYFLLISVLSLIKAAMYHWHIEIPYFSQDTITSILENFDLFSSVIITMAIAHFFAQRFNVTVIMATTLAAATYMTIMVIEENTTAFLFGYSYGLVIQTLVVPIVTTALLRFYYPKLYLNLPLEDHNYHIYKLFNCIFVFLAAYVTTVILYLPVDMLLDTIIDKLDDVPSLSLPDILLVSLAVVTVQFFWFLGIHGEHTFSAFFGSDIFEKTIFAHMTVSEFISLFASIGGSGAGAALLVALLLSTRKRTLRIIAWVAAPFTLFNIDLLLIYAVVVFNRFLLVPFLLIPVFNLAFAYAVITMSGIGFCDHTLPAVTPVFVDAWLKGGENWKLVALQAFLLVIDTAVYLYFLRLYLASQSHTSQLYSLTRRLNVPVVFKTKCHTQPFLAHRSLIDASIKLTKILDEIDFTRLQLYFQPKIDMHQGKCMHFEALLRYRYDDKVAFPEFLSIIEEAGLSSVIDVWVAKEAQKILDRWKAKENFAPTISINLHPDTLKDHYALRTIADYLDKHDIVFEIVEKSFMMGEEALKGIAFLRERGFRIAIDDYGTGYSNLEAIIHHRIDEIKIDKAIIDTLEEPKGKAVCEHIISLCRTLDIHVVAEGVEKARQVRLLQEMGVECIQGFFFSKAIKADRIPVWSSTFELQTYLSSHTD